MANSYDKRSDFNFGIDDIYDDEMYGDDKLDQVLDEIAEIKKTIQGLPEAESYDRRLRRGYKASRRSKVFQNHAKASGRYKKTE